MIDADAVHLTDTDGADILIQIAKHLRSRGATLALAQVHPPVLALWRRAGLIGIIGDHAIFDTIGEAVGRSRASEVRDPSTRDDDGTGVES